jgi:SAM-dependent methyltransferase
MKSISLLPRHLLRYLRFQLIDGPRGAGRPVPTAALDGEYVGGHWDHFFGREELPRQAVLAALIREWFPQPPRVLDLGCGSGRLASLFRSDETARWLGVDLSREGLARARTLGLAHAEFQEGNFESWRPQGELFDSIVFNECIGYAVMPADTLAAFAPYLAPHGRFFLSHFRFGNWAAQWRALERVAPTEFACTVGVTSNKIWDLRVLAPRYAP